VQHHVALNILVQYYSEQPTCWSVVSVQGWVFERSCS